jgi:ATP-dependent RNA helicase SUPV3L1/SUV3
VQVPLHYMSLQEVEDACRLYSAYAWLAYRQPEHFPIRNWPSNCRGKLRIGGRLLHEQNSAARKRQPKLPSLNYR